MATLGEVLDRLHDRAQVYEILAESGDLPLIAELDQLAQEADGDPCELALHAVQAFTSKADDLVLGMTIFLIFPFTRLVHILSAPIWYLGRRGYQIVRTKRFGKA